ncbi:MAG: hypothetical protein JRJ86_14710 [Deltaproteobacteria bacterium]|nr:hypothetical protein [Deltaproteobacteria bacterium]MBW2006309.1 hypothetical protein [Deltaproteobacteria bacterium]MBW2119843.1 hypothetical protein [Deltaproteobacteria bacterium]
MKLISKTYRGSIVSFKVTPIVWVTTSEKLINAIRDAKGYQEEMIKE